MSTTKDELEDFTRFATARLSDDATVSLDEIFDDWWENQHINEDRAAVAASLQDMQNGATGIPYDEFAERFRRLNKLP